VRFLGDVPDPPFVVEQALLDVHALEEDAAARFKNRSVAA